MNTDQDEENKIDVENLNSVNYGCYSYFQLTLINNIENMLSSNNSVKKMSKLINNLSSSIQKHNLIIYLNNRSYLYINELQEAIDFQQFNKKYICCIIGILNKPNKLQLEYEDDVEYISEKVKKYEIITGNINEPIEASMSKMNINLYEFTIYKNFYNTFFNPLDKSYYFKIIDADNFSNYILSLYESSIEQYKETEEIMNKICNEKINRNVLRLTINYYMQDKDYNIYFSVLRSVCIFFNRDTLVLINLKYIKEIIDQLENNLFISLIIFCYMNNCSYIVKTLTSLRKLNSVDNSNIDSSNIDSSNIDKNKSNHFIERPVELNKIVINNLKYLFKIRKYVEEVFFDKILVNSLNSLIKTKGINRENLVQKINKYSSLFKQDSILKIISSNKLINLGMKMFNCFIDILVKVCDKNIDTSSMNSLILIALKNYFMEDMEYLGGLAEVIRRIDRHFYCDYNNLIKLLKKENYKKWNKFKKTFIISNIKSMKEDTVDLLFKSNKIKLQDL